MVDFAQARRTMVDSQLRTFDVNDIPLLDAMETVPREQFVLPGASKPSLYRPGHPRRARSRAALHALADGARPDDPGLEIEPGDRCSMWPAALAIARPSSRPRGTGRRARGGQALARLPAERLAAAGFAACRGRRRAPRRGLSDGAPFDAILVNGAVEAGPEALFGNWPRAGGSSCIQGRAGRRRRHCMSERAKLSARAACSTPRRPCSRRFRQVRLRVLSGRCGVSLFCATGTQNV